MTGFDETVPPDTDPAADGTTAENPRDNVPDEQDERPMGGDDDIVAGHLGE